MKQTPQPSHADRKKQRENTQRRRTDAEMYEAMKRTEPRLRPDLFLASHYE
jgi:hypothetical protein